MLNLLKTKPCLPHDITIIHLTAKLKRLNRRIQRANARPVDYVNRDRVARQLVEAKQYLC